MEVEIIKKILTAFGNPFLNNELKKHYSFEILYDDIQYQEGIFEILELDKNIDFLLINQFLPGEYSLEKLIEKIQETNSKIKIIIFLERFNENLERILIKNGVYRVLYENKIEIQDIIKIINEDDKMEKYNYEIRKEIEELKNIINKNNYKKIKNKKINLKKYILKFYKKLIKKLKIINKKIILKINRTREKNIFKNKQNNKINNKKIINKKIFDIKLYKNYKTISILGANGSGKSVFSVMLAFYLKKYKNKILIIDFDFFNNSIHTILGVKKYPEIIKEKLKKSSNNFENMDINNLIIKINNKIDLISGINILFNSFNKTEIEQFKNNINKLKNNYDLIIFDTSSECFFDYTKEIINLCDNNLFLTEGNLLEISKSKILLDIYFNDWKIDKNKINIIFNKYKNNNIDINILKNIFYNNKILGLSKFKKNINLFINNNFIKNTF